MLGLSLTPCISDIQSYVRLKERGLFYDRLGNIDKKQFEVLTRSTNFVSVFCAPDFELIRHVQNVVGWCVARNDMPLELSLRERAVFTHLQDILYPSSLSKEKRKSVVCGLVCQSRLPGQHTLDFSYRFFLANQNMLVDSL
jgi:hypothetical protein